MTNPFSLGAIQRSEAETPDPANDNPFALRNVQADRGAQLRNTLNGAVQSNPDAASDAARLGKRYQIAPDVALRNVEELRQREQADNARATLADAPALTETLIQRPFVAKQAHADISTLAGVESMLRSFLDPVDPKPAPPKAGVLTNAMFRARIDKVMAANPALDVDTARALALQGSTLDNISTGFLEPERPKTTLANLIKGIFTNAREAGVQAGQGAERFIADVIGAEATAERAAAQSKASRDRQFVGVPEPESRTGRNVYGGINSLVQQTPGLAASIITGTPAPALASIFGTTYGPNYNKYRDRGATIGEATMGSTLESGLEVATEFLPMKIITDKIGKVGIKGFMQQYLGAELWTEEVNTVLSGAVDTAIANPDKTWGQYFAELPSNMLDTAVQTLVQSGILAGASRVLQSTVMAGQAQEYRNMERIAQAERLIDMLKAATEVGLREKSPEEFRAVMQSMVEQTEGAPQQVFVDAEVLAQLPGEVLAQLPGVAEQMQNALASGDVVSIKMADVLTVAPGTPLEQTLAEHARIGDPWAMSQFEAKQASEQAQVYLQQKAAEVIQQASDQQAMQESSDRVRQGVLEQLNATKRFRKEVNEAYATWTTAFYTTMAGRLGITPEKMAAKYPLRIVDATGAGGVLNTQADRTQSVTLAGRDVPVTLSRQDAQAGYSLTNVDTALFDAGFKAADDQFRQFYVGAQGEGGIAGRYERFAEFSATAKSVEAPTVSVDANGKVSFGNGRHRFAFMRDQGVGQIPVAMDAESLANATRFGYTTRGNTRTDQTQTPEFQNWFGDSKVVDAAGKPIKMFHATDVEFTAFNTPSYFTEDSEDASGYGGRVEEVFVSIRNPYWADDTEQDAENRSELTGISEEYAAELARQGYDGVMGYRNGQTLWAIPFTPTQIKSAIGNSGAFDPGDANILKQADAKVNNLTSVAERGERITGTRASISPEEKAAIAAASEKVGVSVKEITAVVRGHKLAHPPAQGWAPLVFNRAVIDKGKISYEYKSTPYSFNADKDGTALEPGTPEYKRRVNAVAKAMTEEVRRVFKRATAGDKNAQNILAQAGWYKAMRSRLRQEFGGLGDLFADLLGATSPNTPVRDNWTNAVDSLRRASRGDFDALIPQWEAHYDRLEALELDLRGWFNERLAEGLKKNKIKALPEYETKLAAVRAARELPEELLPTKESGKKYGFNGKNVARAMVDLWRVVRNADPDIARGGTAPKALNFSGNLIGFRERATIDVWAARMLQRLAGGVRVPSMAETGVSGDMREDATATLGFGFGQDVFSAAVKRIRADEELKTDKTLADVNDDDLQAVVWFVEKELWTVNNWTSVAGEGGSFELEASLTGSAEQNRIKELRKIIDSSKSKPAAKAQAREELAALERTVDRFVGGLSIQMSADTQGVDFVPTDADMARLAEQVRLAVYEADNGNTVLASKALATEGRYGGVERSLDLEVVAREGYDANRLWLEMLRQARAAKQDSTFLSRVLREHEEYDPVRHRPGVEIYFREAASRDKLEDTLANLAKEGVEFLTVIVDGRRLEGAVEGSMPPAVGVRLQYVPEFDQRYGFDNLSSLDDAGIRDKMEGKAAELRALAERVTATVEGVSFAGQFWYDTQVAFAHEYQEKIDGIATGSTEEGTDRVGGPQWSGQPVRQGLESADRQSRETTSGEPDGDVLGGDALGTTPGVGPDGLLYQAQRTGPGRADVNDGRDGRSPNPHAVDITGVHFSTGQRTSLDGRYFGTGLKGAEQTRLRESTDPRIRERVYFYIDEGAGVRPEAGVGGYAHEVPLTNLYNTQGDPLKLFKAGDLNGSESRVLDAGYDGYYFPAYANQQGIAIVMGAASRGMAATPIANPTQVAPELTPPKPYTRGLMSREINALDMAPVVAAAPSARLRAGTFQVDQAEFAAAQAAMREQGIDLPDVFNQPARGTFNPKTLELALNENADLSTFIHETGHFFLEVMADLASQPDAPVDVREDMDKLLKWFGVADLATWNALPLDGKRPSHERFAESIEQYVLEGKAPSTELQPVFRRLKSFLLSVYQSIKNFVAGHPDTKLQLPAEVQQVFDRMLASEEQIAQAEEVAGLLPDMNATEDAKEKLTARSIRDLKWAVGARSKMIKAMQAQAAKLRKEVEAEVRAEVDEMPVYQAMDARERALEKFAEDPFAVDAGLDSIATQYGYTSLDHMMREIENAEPKAEMIQGLTDQRMLERHGDLIDQRAIEEAANAAVHNDARAKALATELSAQAEMLNPREETGKTTKKGNKLTVNAIVQAGKIFAANIVSRTTVRDLQTKARQHLAAEARAGKRWLEATKKADTQAAVKAKQDQVLNNAAAKAAMEAKDDVAKMVDYLRKFDKESIRKNLPVDYLDQIDKLLEAIDLRVSTSGAAIDKRASLRKWVESQQALGLDPILPENLLEDMVLTSYKEMTVEQITDLVDIVKNIEHLGRLKSKLLAAKDKREFDVIATEIADEIAANGGKPLPVQLEPDGRIKKFFKGAWADHRKLNSLVHQMDGGKDNGPFYRALVRSMNDAGADENVRLEKATEALAKIYKPIEALPGGISGAKLYIPEIKNSLTRAGRLSVALNWGNAQNRQRVLSGDNWTEAQVNAILKTLTPVELEFVNNVWEHIDSYWPDVKAKQLRVSGVVEDKVEAEPFDIEVGIGNERRTIKMRGGYYPIKYDGDRSVRAERNEAKERAAEIMRGAVARPTTRRGHTKARVDEVQGRPVKKDLSVITQHVNQVVHDLAWHEWFIDANRILNDPRILGAIRDHHGPDIHRAMTDAVEAIAVGDAVHQGQIDKLLLLMRANVTRSIMGASLTTALLQPFGLTQSMARIGVVPVLKGAGRWAGDAVRMESTVAWINEKSDFMRLRSKTFNRELREISQRVQGKSKFMQVADASLFFLMQKLQMVADVPTWVGAYEKALAGGVDESAAVALADEAVLSSQGGGTTKDLAAVQRNMPFLTQFYSYFNTTLNLVAEKTALTDFKNPRAAAGWLGDMALLAVVPAILPALITYLLKGGDEDDPEKLAKKMLEWQASYLLGMFVGLRELPTLWSPFDYGGPPAAKLLNDGKRLVQQAGQGEIDDPAVLATIGFLGTALGIPTTQIIRSYKGWLAWDEGDAPATSILFGPPPRD